MNKIINFITKHLKDLIYLIIVFLLLILLTTAVNKCSQIKNEYRNNIEALNDTIHYYKGKDGQMVAFKKSFQADLNTLKLLNEEFYNKLKNIKPQGNITSGADFSGVIDNGKHDTTYVVSHDTISKGFSHDFAFNNEYRKLEGNVNYKNDTVGVKLLKDELYFDYTVALDDKNNVYITSSNPYVKYNQITGFQLPKAKQKRWSLGPGIGVGYDPIQNKPSFNIGVSLNYGLFKW